MKASFRLSAALCGTLMCALAVAPEAKSVSAVRWSGDPHRPHIGVMPPSVFGPTSSADENALHEMLEGQRGRREMWSSAPALVVISTELDYERGDMSSGFVALSQPLGEAELAQLETDLTVALDELTDGTFPVFSAITVETARSGDSIKVVRPGQIVVARYRGVQAKTGNLGFGGRLTHAGTILGAAVILDSSFDSKSAQRQLLRTHELGHALGYNHVESRPSVMNARVGSSITDFDRLAIRAAFDAAAQR